MRISAPLKRISSVLLICFATGSCFAAGPATTSTDSTPAAPDAAKPKGEVVPAQTPKKWVCEADGLAEFRYSGEDWAYIRLVAYSSGHEYRVTKDATGDIAKGSTQDRTTFVCTNK